MGELSALRDTHRVTGIGNWVIVIWNTEKDLGDGRVAFGCQCDELVVARNRGRWYTIHEIDNCQFRV